MINVFCGFPLVGVIITLVRTEITDTVGKYFVFPLVNHWCNYLVRALSLFFNLGISSMVPDTSSFSFFQIASSEQTEGNYLQCFLSPTKGSNIKQHIVRIFPSRPYCWIIVYFVLRLIMYFYFRLHYITFIIFIQILLYYFQKFCDLVIVLINNKRNQ